MKQNRLLEDPVRSVFLSYLVPSVSATLVTSIYILADTMMIGRGIGSVGIAALNILLPLYSTFFWLWHDVRHRRQRPVRLFQREGK